MMTCAACYGPKYGSAESVVADIPGQVSDADDSDGHILMVFDDEAADFFLLDEVDGFGDLGIIVAGDAAFCHDVADAGMCGVASLGVGTDADVAVGDGSDDLLPLSDGQHADVALPHNFGGVLNAVVRADEFDITCHDFFDLHLLSSPQE